MAKKAPITTEAEWLSCNDPDALLECARGRVSERKLRLFGCACCRQVWPFFTDERSRRAVEVVERYADGAATVEELEGAYSGASVALDLAVGPASDAPRLHRSRRGTATSWAARELSNVPAEGFAAVVWENVTDACAYARDVQRGRCRDNTRAQVDLAHDIFGNPFRPLRIEPEWRTSTAINLARTIYEERAFDRMPILADALEDGGCTDAGVLGHCRGPGPQVRGCHVVDGIMGRG
jgi:hypothetical protein